MRNVLIFDTTLRDGEKSPGTILTIEEKIRVAKQIARLQVDILEAGFPAASENQFQAVSRIAKEIRGPVVVALARATNPRDFEIAREALKDAERPRLHTFVPASAIYREHFLKKNFEQTKDLAIAAVKKAKEYIPDVEFSLVDAFRADPEEVVRLVQAVIDAGATTVNLADTVGYASPGEIGELFRKIGQEVNRGDQVVFSVHCHNDLGLAVANSLAAVAQGANQVHCTVNGVGERAGNTPLEELAAVLNTRASHFNAETRIRMDQIHSTSRLVQRLTGVNLQPHKPVVGTNAFVCEGGVPQLADAAEKPPYEIMDPAKLGIRTAGEALTETTTVEQFRARAGELGYDLQAGELNECYQAFQELAGKKESIFDADLEFLLNQVAGKEQMRYELLYLNVSAGSISVPNATVQLRMNGEVVQDAGFGHGPVDAAFKTIFKMVRRFPRLVRYEVNAVTSGTDAQGEVTIRLEENGLLVNGRGVGTDIVLASAKALIDGLNKLERIQKYPVVSEFTDEESWTPRL